MSKEAYYFSHDSNARNDPAILKLLKAHGWSGYGLFWAVVEMLRDEPNYKLETQYDVYAFALRTDAEMIRSIVEDFGLFEIKNNFFFSQSLLRRMKKKEEKSRKASESAKLRWEKRNANAMRTHSDGNAIKERKGKERVVGKKGSFSPPSIEEIKAYCKERNNNVTPEKWLDHYTANGWMVGKNKMKDWKAAVRTWERNDIGSKGGDGWT